MLGNNFVKTQTERTRCWEFFYTQVPLRLVSLGLDWTVFAFVSDWQEVWFVAAVWHRQRWTKKVWPAVPILGCSTSILDLLRALCWLQSFLWGTRFGTNLVLMLNLGLFFFVEAPSTLQIPPLSLLRGSGKTKKVVITPWHRAPCGLRAQRCMLILPCGCVITRRRSVSTITGCQ